MCEENDNRVDEISEYYKPVGRLNFFIMILFWSLIFLSLGLLFSQNITENAKNKLQYFFVVLFIVHFILLQVSKHFLSKAEEERRKQLLSDAFNVPLSNEKTTLYYNNKYPPSFLRLGAIILENTYFGKRITNEMLKSKRLFTCLYVLIWLLIIIGRENNLTFVTWVTQFVFSGEIVMQWVFLERLHYKYNHIYNELHNNYLNKIDGNTIEGKVTIINALVNYESAKASYGIKTSTKIFNEINPKLTHEWEKIRTLLRMDVFEDTKQ